MTITIEINRTADNDGWDLQCGEDKTRNVSGLVAERIMHGYCTECLNALQSVIDRAEPIEPDEPDYELESDRHSGTPDHRYGGGL